ncbi:hypothetical protein Tco_0858246 [Tanacetum coccineum]|uniref:Uncharacterized protein n=1 Tax=Tanacetum coccineum TaxID=301880 RepID=A0ABQ5BCN9_9ASTR
MASAQDGEPLQDDVRLCLGNDLKKAQDHSQRQAFLVQKLQSLHDYKDHADNFICLLVPGAPFSQSEFTPGWTWSKVAVEQVAVEHVAVERWSSGGGRWLAEAANSTRMERQMLVHFERERDANRADERELIRLIAEVEERMKHRAALIREVEILTILFLMSKVPFEWEPASSPELIMENTPVDLFYGKQAMEIGNLNYNYGEQK